MAPEPITTKAPAPALGAQVSRAVIWNTLFVPFRMLAEVAATFVKLTVLPLESYGLLALVSGASSGLGIGIDLGTTRALPKYIPETNRSGGPRATLRLLLAVLGAQIAVLLVVAVALVLLRADYLAMLDGMILADGRLKPDAQSTLLLFVRGSGWLLIAMILLLLLLGIGFDILMAYLNSFFKQRAWNSITLVAGLLLPLLSAAAVLAGWGITGVLVAMVIAPAIAVALASWQVLRLHRAIVALPQSPDNGRVLPPGFVRYCGVSLLMTLTDFLASKSFVVFLARSISDAALLWAGASVVSMVLGYLYTPMVGVQVPLFTRVRAGEGGTLLGAYQSLVRLQVLLLLPGAVGLLLLARPVFALVIPKYVAAAPLVWVLAPCLFLESLLTTAHNALIVYERFRIIVISRLLTLIGVPLVLLLSPTLGILGAALAFGLARIVAGMWVTASGYRLLGLRWPWRFTLRVALASGVMALLVALLGRLLPVISEAATLGERLRALPLVLGVAAIGAVGFMAALRLAGGIDQDDRQRLLGLKFGRLLVKYL
jgi:O-antigen/teichoic acid export membrane protein